MPRADDDDVSAYGKKKKPVSALDAYIAANPPKIPAPAGTQIPANFTPGATLNYSGPNSAGGGLWGTLGRLFTHGGRFQASIGKVGGSENSGGNGTPTSPPPPAAPKPSLFEEIIAEILRRDGANPAASQAMAEAERILKGPVGISAEAQASLNSLGGAFDQQLGALAQAAASAQNRHRGNVSQVTDLYNHLKSEIGNQGKAVVGQYGQSSADVGKSAGNAVSAIQQFATQAQAPNNAVYAALGISPARAQAATNDTVANAAKNIQQGAANYQGLLGANQATDKSLFGQYGTAAGQAGAAAVTNLGYALEKFLQANDVQKANVGVQKATALESMRQSAMSQAQQMKMAQYQQALQKAQGLSGDDGRKKMLLEVAKLIKPETQLPKGVDPNTIISKLLEPGMTSDQIAQIIAAAQTGAGG